MAKKEKFDLSRRDFLKKTAMATAGVAVMASGCSSPSSGAALPKWDKEADVVVVGSGTVAMAALVAAKEGAKVILIEKGPAFGGTTSLSGGVYWVPNNYVMREAGIADSREGALKLLKRITENQSKDELIETYVDAAPQMVEYMRDRLNWPSGLTLPGSYQDYYSGEGTVPFGRSISLIDADGKSIYGQGLSQKFKTALEELGVEILLETPGKKLVTNEAGEVIGVLAETGGTQLAIKANKSVIIGTGGFDFNREWTQNFLRGPIYWSNAVQTNTGDGHAMGMELGASLRSMNESWGLSGFVLDAEKMLAEADWGLYRGKPGAIVVNKYGERIGNESSSYDLFQRAFYCYDNGNYEWRNIPAFFIADGSYAEHYPFLGARYQMGVVPDWMEQADTLEELAQKLGIDMAGLQSTLDVFNPNAEKGIDPIYHRGEFAFDLDSTGDNLGRTDLKNGCLAPIAKPPFYGAQYHPGTCGTSGGLEINKNGQVLHVNGNPIPRLYAVGNTSGCIFGASYPGAGATVGAGMTFGYLAALHAIALEPTA